VPFVTIYMQNGCADQPIETCMKQITAAGEEILENTLQRMVRVTVFETEPERVYQAGEKAEQLAPTVLFRVGPGRSAAAKDAFMKRICDILHENLGCDRQAVRSYVMDNEEGHHFCIGGKHKDFGKKVK
jgi:phenylpyruvate tautomerase PptA (4-oxalocrotonate tautomerase family)